VRILTALLFLTAVSVTALAQDQYEYKVDAIRGQYMLIGRKPYKIIGDCSRFQAGDDVAFSEEPITCERVTVINLDRFTSCELECLENLGTPPPPNY
jgi:hypothetical protein